MRRLLTFAGVLLVCAVSANATIRLTGGNTTMSALAPVPTDTIYVRAAHTLTVDVNHVGTTCAAIVDSGKMIHNAGSRINIGGLRVLGTDSMLAGSRMDIYNDDRLGADDIQIAGSGKFYAIGTTTSQVQIFGQTTNGILPNWPTTYSNQTVYLRRANIRGFQGTWPSAGLTFTSFPSGRVRILHCDFDSASISYRLTGGHLLLGCTFDTYLGMNRAIIVATSPNDTIMACRVRHNALGGTNDQSQGIYVWSNNTVIYGCNIKDTNFSAITHYGGDYGVRVEQNVSGTKMMFDTVTSWQWGVGVGQGSGLFVYGCELVDGEHECLITAHGDLTIQNSLIRSRYAARAIVTLGYGVPSVSNISLLYNTIVAEIPNIAKSAVSFDCPTPPCALTATNVTFVGNIFDSDNPSYPGDFGIYGGTVTFTDFKDNAMGQIDTTTNASDIILPYSITDSNTFTETYGFINPAINNYGLGVGSPMKNAADSAYGCQVYGNFRAATKPFNIGFDNFYNRWNYSKYSPTGKTDSAWIRTACLTYSLTQAAVRPFLGRKYDVLINGGASIATARTQDSMTKSIAYATLTSFRAEDYNTILPGFRSAYYPGVASVDSFGLKLGTTGGNVTIAGQQSSCSTVPTTTTPGNVLKFCGWTEANRWCPDFRLPITQHYVAHKVINHSISSINDGIMQDEASIYKAAKCCGSAQDQYGMFWPFTAGDWTPAGSFNLARGWEGKTYLQIRDSLIQLKRNVWGKRVEDTLRLYGFQNFGNFTNYALPLTTEGDMSDPYGDARDIGTGHLTYENALAPYIYGQLWNGWAWKSMDSIKVWDTAQMIVWTTIMPAESLAVAGAGGWKRLQMERLVWYYMAASRKTIYCLSSNMPGPDLRPNDYTANDSLYKWTKACERNVGQPTGARTVVATGTDPAGQAYTLYRRNYTKAIMIYRQQGGTNYGASTAITYNLGQIATPLTADNTTGTQSSTASIRNMEGQIYLISQSHELYIASASPVTEGGQLAFVVSRNWSDAAVTINYNTVDGTAVAPEDYVAELNGQLTIPAGFSTGTIFILTNADALLEPTQTMSVHLSSSSDGSIITADANGSILDGTTQPSPTTEKKLKLKKE